MTKRPVASRTRDAHGIWIFRITVRPVTIDRIDMRLAANIASCERWKTFVEVSGTI